MLPAQAYALIDQAAAGVGPHAAQLHMGNARFIKRGEHLRKQAAALCAAAAVNDQRACAARLANQTARLLLKVCCTFTVLACLVGCFGSRWLARLFTPDADLVRLTALVARIYFAGIWAFGMQMACQCCFMGMGQAKISLFLALLRKVILLVPLAILLPRLTGSVFGIYAAEPIADILASCTAITLFLRKRDQLLPAE